MKILGCHSETSDIGPDILELEGENEFMLLLSRDKEASDYLTVYFDDEEILKGDRAKEVLGIIERASNNLVGESREIFEGFVSALKSST